MRRFRRRIWGLGWGQGQSAKRGNRRKSLSQLALARILALRSPLIENPGVPGSTPGLPIGFHSADVKWLDVARTLKSGAMWGLEGGQGSRFHCGTARLN